MGNSKQHFCRLWDSHIGDGNNYFDEEYFDNTFGTQREREIFLRQLEQEKEE